MSPKHIFSIVVPVVGVCILGLLIAQIMWFRDAYELKDDQFRDKVFVLLDRAGNALKSNPDMQEKLLTTAGPLTVTSSAEASGFVGEFRQFLDSVFAVNQTGIPYHFAILEGCGAEQVLLSDLPLHQATQLEFQTAESFSCYIPGQLESRFLGLHFPRKQQYLLGQTGGMLGLSIGFLMAMLGAFAAMIWVIRRQKQLAAIKNDFINNLTHEFKTPIASISLAASILQKEEGRAGDRQAQSYLQLIGKESKRLENQVDKLLQMAMVDSGNFSLEKEAVNLHELLAKVTDSCSILLQRKGGQIETDLRASRPVIQGDPAHLFNLFYNLLDNAIKYSDGPVDIRLRTRDDTDGLYFSIRDHGIGMEEEVQQKVFEKFYRARQGDVHETKGFGLGLSYVKSIVRAHRGRISFWSRLDEGTEFSLILPKPER